MSEQPVLPPELRYPMREEDYVFISLEEATSPPASGLFEHHVDCWWIVHPDKGLAFHNPLGSRGQRQRSGAGAPQCNPNEGIARLVFRKTPRSWPAELVFIPSAWARISVSDYTG